MQQSADYIAFEEGATAFYLGSDANPYAHPSQNRDEWDRGFSEAASLEGAVSVGDNFLDPIQ